MDREFSSSSATSTPGYVGAKRLPPWEVSDLPQVPHISSSAPPLSKAEMQALPSLWATRTTSATPPSAELDGSFQDSRCPASSPPSRTNTGTWSERKPSLADSARATPPPEHRHMDPAYESVHGPAPPTNRQAVVALPGTMSSRSNVGQSRIANSDKVPNNRRHKKGSKDPKQSTPLGHRFKSAVKDLFRKETVDDREFEQIGERHWSED